MREKIFIQGYGYSGGTLVGDFLREFEDINYIRTEFDICRHTGGLYELGELIETSGYYVKDAVIRDTIKLFNLYKTQWPKGFEKYGDAFLNQLIFTKIASKTRYYGHTVTLKFPSCNWKGFKNEILKKLFINKYNEKTRDLNLDKNVYHLNFISKEDYIEIAKSFLENIFDLYPNNQKTVIHHPLNIIGCKVDTQVRYWDNFKVIIIDKDPRDIYTTMCKDAENFDYCKAFVEPLNFIKDYKGRRKFHKENLKTLKKDGVCFLQCEDFIFNYDKTTDFLCNFLNLDKNKQLNKLKYFNPKVSVQNVGIYKNFKNQNAISLIEKECLPIYEEMREQNDF